MSAYNGILHNVLPAAAENMNQEERDAQGGFNRGSLVRSSSNNGSGMGLGGQQDQQQLLSLFHQKLTKNTVKE